MLLFFLILNLFGWVRKVIDFEVIFDFYVFYLLLCINGFSFGIVFVYSRVILFKIGWEGKRDFDIFKKKKIN